jgi:pimeloyl-ACP methyl ester carboxylesterase
MDRDVPIIVIPGMQGHREWMQPAIAALERTSTVRSFSLNVEDGVGDPFDQWNRQIDLALESTGASKAILVAVSFGGLVGVHYAATHAHRVAALILVSAPSPRMPLTTAEQRLLEHPFLLLPFFAVRGLQRLLPEVWSARSTWGSRLAFLCQYGWQVVRRPLAPHRSARWIRAWQSRDLTADCAKISAPTHIITGEDTLDRVVPTSSTRDYLTLIPGSTAATLPRTGHIGLVSRPTAFADVVRSFIDDLDTARSRRSA